jgi:hypothetical protein
MKISHAVNVKTASLAALVFVALFAFSGCATTDKNASPASLNQASQVKASESLEQQAMARSRARWDAIIGGKHMEAFDFLTPASQIGTSREAYGTQMAQLRVKSAKVEGATCKDEVCEVNVTLEIGITVRRVGEVVTAAPYKETWSVVNGQLGLIRR